MFLLRKDNLLLENRTRHVNNIFQNADVPPPHTPSLSISKYK
jgi:hypothetical protein